MSLSQEFKEERESLLKYWKQDQQKLAKLVGPDYDNVALEDVRLMDLTTVESLAAEQNRKLGEGVQVLPLTHAHCAHSHPCSLTLTHSLTCWCDEKSRVNQSYFRGVWFAV